MPFQTSIAFSLIVFLFGTIVGSFINVLVYRLKNGIKGILKGRSFCPHCKKNIKGYDLIPVFSFFILGRKCRYCKKKISWKYPVVEAITGVVFVFIFWYVFSVPFDGWKLAVYFLYGFILVAISVYDVYYKEIPDKVIMPSIFVAFVLSLLGTFFPFFSPPLQDSLIGVGITVVFFGAQVLFSKETWMGWGDVFIGIFMGLVLGWELTLVAVFLSYIVGSVVGLVLLLFFKKTGRTAVPFGPFLSLGVLVALGWGDKILGWYMSLLS